MDTAFTARDFLPQDRDIYLQMSREFYSSKAVLHSIPDENILKTFRLCLEKDPFVRGLLVLVDGKPAGYGLLSFTWSNEAGGSCVLLEEAYILPRYQGGGIGGAFLDQIEQEYIKAGRAKRLRLEVAPENTRAIALYERKGFARLDYVQMLKDV